MEHKGHFSPRSLGMLKELGAWGKAPQRVPYGWGWCVPCAIQGQLTDPAECRMKSHCQWHVSVELGYLFSHSTSVDQS